MMDFDEKIILESEHLYLRFLREEDRQALFENINHDEEVLTYYVDTYAKDPEDIPIEKVISNFREKQMYIFAIVLKENDEFIGTILQCNKPDRVFNSVEVGYAIGRKHWNKGYVTEAMKLMIGLLFDSGVHKVRACHIVGNEASGRVMEKCGMTYEGRRVDDLYYHGKYHDTLNYYILNQEV